MRLPLQGDRFYTPDGSDWQRVWSALVSGDAIFVQSFTGSLHKVRWNSKKWRWEEYEVQNAS